jgi:hypothetical protein
LKSSDLPRVIVATTIRKKSSFYFRISLSITKMRMKYILPSFSSVLEFLSN